MGFINFVQETENKIVSELTGISTKIGILFTFYLATAQKTLALDVRIGRIESMKI